MSPATPAQLAPRHVLEAALKPLLPKRWKVIPYQRATDKLSAVTVMLRQLSIVRTPASPNGAHDIRFSVVIRSPREDMTKAEDELDDAVNALTHAIDEAGIAWTEASKVLDDNELGYDITLTITSSKE